MRIGTLLIAGVAALASAAVTPAQIVAGIKQITEQMSLLQSPAQSITIVNAPLFIIGQGPFPVIISGFSQVVVTTTSLAAQIGSGVSRRRAVETRQDPALDVADAFRDLTRVSQNTFNILIGKAGLLQNVPLVGPPVAAVLRQVEASFDAIASLLVDRFKSAADDLASNADSLAATLDIAIKAYEELQI